MKSMARLTVKNVSFIFFFLIILIPMMVSCPNPIMVEILGIKRIDFNSNGGTPVSGQQVWKNERITRPADPSKSGYNFSGWYEDNGSFNKLWDFNNYPSSDMTLYARWEGGSPTIIITANPVSTSVVEGTSVTLSVTAVIVPSGGSLTYQWFSNTANSNLSGTPITSETNSNFTVPNTLGIGTYYYFCEVSSSKADTVRSAAAEVTVVQYPVTVTVSSVTTSYANLATALASITTAGNYIVEIASHTSPPASFTGNALRTVTFVPFNTSSQVQLEGNGSLVTVVSGVALTLGNGITLNGHSGNNASLVLVNSGTLIMNSGSVIQNNNAKDGGGVYINNGGSFTMDGGEIRGNTAASNGGGVYIASSTVTMTGGIIKNNTASGLYGGGV